MVGDAGEQTACPQQDTAPHRIAALKTEVLDAADIHVVGDAGAPRAPNRTEVLEAADIQVVGQAAPHKDAAPKAEKLEAGEGRGVGASPQATAMPLARRLDPRREVHPVAATEVYAAAAMRPEPGSSRALQPGKIEAAHASVGVPPAERPLFPIANLAARLGLPVSRLVVVAAAGVVAAALGVLLLTKRSEPHRARQPSEGQPAAGQTQTGGNDTVIRKAQLGEDALEKASGPAGGPDPRERARAAPVVHEPRRPHGAERASQGPTEATHPGQRERRAHPSASQPTAGEHEEGPAAQLRARARKRYQARRYREAARLYREATGQAPDHPGSYAGLGAAELALGNVHAATEAYTRAVELAPYRSGFHAALGRAYLAARDRARARHAYERALELDPDNAAATRALRGLDR